MSDWLLDTNVVSELRKPVASARVLAWYEGQPAGSLHFSRVTIAEIRFGLERLTAGVRRAALEAWFRDVIRPWIAGRVLEADEDVLTAWQHVVDAQRRRGVTMGAADALIAATALVHGHGVATRNVAHFGGTGVPLVNPWETG